MANISINTRLYNTLPPFNVALVVFCSIIVVVGLAGNSIVIAIVCKTRSMSVPGRTSCLRTLRRQTDIISLMCCPIPLVTGLSGTNISGENADYIYVHMCKFSTGYSVNCVTVQVTYLSGGKIPRDCETL